MDQRDQESEMDIDLSLKIDVQEDEKSENGDQNQKVHEEGLDEEYSQDKEADLQDENKSTEEVLYYSLSLYLSIYVYTHIYEDHFPFALSSIVLSIDQCIIIFAKSFFFFTSRW